MLAAMRRNSRHAIIYVLFGILIAAFVISFGPGSRGFGYSGVTSAYAAKIARACSCGDRSSSCSRAARAKTSFRASSGPSFSSSRSRAVGVAGSRLAQCATSSE